MFVVVSPHEREGVVKEVAPSVVPIHSCQGRNRTRCPGNVKVQLKSVSVSVRVPVCACLYVCELAREVFD